MAEKLRLENVVKIYGNNPRRRALKMLQEGVSKDEILDKTGHVVGVDDVSFSIAEGETFVVMGLSGSGKSTLIRCVNRLLEPTAGSIYVDGDDITKLDRQGIRELRRNRMAMVFQHFGLFPHKTVAYNAAYGLRVRGLPEDEQRERAINALDMVGLKPWADHYPHNLSGGMQQRVGLARALATDADILLMDEAFSALDPLIRREMQDELVKLQQELHKTILFITHDLGEALRLGDRVTVMRDGKVVQIGTPQEIITEPADDYVADFMADVDSGKVLTAEFIMSPAHSVKVGKYTPKEVLARMDRYEVDHLYVVNKMDQPEGIINRNKLESLQNKPKAELEDAIRADYLETANTSQLSELYKISGHGEPIAVLDDNGKLQGVVYPLDIFDALSLSTEATAETSSENGSGSDADIGEPVDTTETTEQNQQVTAN